MAVTAADVKALRDKTGAGMMDCKKALVETDGDMAAAERKLKELGLAAAAKRSGRAATEGRVFATIASDAAALVELASETDFVARNAKFIELGQELVKKIAAERLAEADDSVKASITDAIATIKENIELRRMRLLAVADGDSVAEYIHGEGSIGVLVKLHTADAASADNPRVKETAFDLALHVAAFAPPYLSPDSVDQSYLDEQEQIFRAQAEGMDKPANVIDGIVKGKLRKHLQEVCLLEQPFVKEQKQSVKDVVAALGKEIGSEVSVSDYQYLKVGGDAFGTPLNGTHG